MTRTAAAPSGVGRWWTAVPVLAVVLVSAAVAQAFGRFSYGIVLPDVEATFGLSHTTAGLFGTLNVGAYLLGTVVVARLASVLSLVDLMRVGLCLSATGLAALAFATSAWMLAPALILTGLGGACIWIPSPRLAANALPDRYKGVAAGMAGMGIAVGIAVLGWGARRIDDAGGRPGWQRLYSLEAIIGVATLVLVFAVLRQRGTPSTAGGFGGFGALSRVRDWKALTAAYAAYGFMYLLVLQFFTLRLTEDAGYEASEAAARFGLIGLAGIAGGLIMGRVSDSVGRGRTITVAFVVYGVSTLLILWGEPAAVLAGALGIGLTFSGLPSVIAAAVVDGTDATTFGPAYAAATLAFGLAQVTSPQIGGWLADVTGSFTVTLGLAVVFAVVGAASASRMSY